MDFSAVLQFREKKLWWVDVILYLSVSFLIAVIFCYVIFSVRTSMIKSEIAKETTKLETVGTTQQKEYEKEVLAYQKKINSFKNFLKNIKFASSGFIFMEEQTLPYIWFKNFSFNQQSNTIQISGEAEDMESVSRQVNRFEKNEYVKSIGLLNFSIGQQARTQFNMSLVLDPKIFKYSEPEPVEPIEETVESSGTSTPVEELSQPEESL